MQSLAPWVIEKSLEDLKPFNFIWICRYESCLLIVFKSVQFYIHRLAHPVLITAVVISWSASRGRYEAVC